MLPLVIIAKLESHDWLKASFGSRLTLIKQHYSAYLSHSSVKTIELYLPDIRVGVFIAYQAKSGFRFKHESRSEHQIDFISHPPYGTFPGLSGIDPTKLAFFINSTLAKDPGLIIHLSPPILAVHIDLRSPEVLVSNDFLGIARLFQLGYNKNTIYSTHPFATHLFGLHHPVLSPIGWASHHCFGWFISEMSPFENLVKVPGGTSIAISREGIIIERLDVTPNLFSKDSGISKNNDCDEYAGQVDSYFKFDEIGCALSGGRDSRASSAIFSNYFPSKVFFRTNIQPELENVVAKNCIRTLPWFSHLNAKEDRAYSEQGRLIWRGKKVETESMAPCFITRAYEWTKLSEGQISPGAFYREAPFYLGFAPSDNLDLMVSGLAGESAKAYYWSINMISGAYAKNPSQFLKEIRSVHPNKRLLDHPLTAIKKPQFIYEAYKNECFAELLKNRDYAAAAGITGYRFFDYWLLTNRFAMSNPPFGVETLLPFMMPSFIANALNSSPVQRCQASYLSSIVNTYRPEWEFISYFDELQNKVPSSMRMSHNSRPFLGQSPHYEQIYNLIIESPAFEDPYDKYSILSFFDKEISTADPSRHGSINLSLLHLLMRHSMWLLVGEISSAIDHVISNEPN